MSASRCRIQRVTGSVKIFYKTLRQQDDPVHMVVFPIAHALQRWQKRIADLQQSFMSKEMRVLFHEKLI
ncbi:hypothetical protein AA11825_2508 [Acetobacter pomorum DSM 11825]|nr:hypothetical protein AA11825_2508 [Acetobacter pomorum DSM 11825]